ncbi:MAG: hypothetical protein ACRECQ_09745, partial [Burkholderiaceae bacterium]
MRERVRGQSLFIDSARCNPGETPGAYTVTFPPGAVQCHADETLVLTLKRFTARATWYWIPRDMRLRVELNEIVKEVTVTAGNPSLKELALEITRGVDDDKFRCRADRPTNRLIFDAGDDAVEVLVSFIDPELAPLLGFDTPPTPALRAIKSDRALKPLAFDALKVHISGVTAEGLAHNMANMRGELMQATNVIAAFPADVEAFTLLDFRNLDDSFAMPLADKALTQLRVQLTDFDDAPIAQLPHHVMQLQVDTYRT